MKHGYSAPQVPSDIPRQIEAKREQGYYIPDPGKTYIDLHDRYLSGHRGGFREAARQWERSARFDYRYVMDATELDLSWESLRGYWDGYQHFKTLICHQQSTSGLTPFVLGLPAPMPSEPISVDASEVVFTLEWLGFDPLEQWGAAFAAYNRKDELTQWQKQQSSTGNYPIALITAEEAASIWLTLHSFDVLLRVDDPPYWIGGTGWLNRMVTKANRYYADVGVSDEAVSVLEDIRKELDDDHRAPIDGVIERVTQRMKSPTRRPPDRRPDLHD